MGVLAEYVRKEADHLRDEVAKRGTLLKDWLASIDRLFTELEGWVREADGGIGLLTTSRADGPMRQEYSLGAYHAPTLRVHLGGPLSGRSAQIVARSRHVAATVHPPGEAERRADGMVEIWDGGVATDYLFRLAGGSEEPDRWFIRGVTAWNANPESREVEELTRERFEAAVLRVLK
jgi:hypothetical protein